MSSQQGRGEGVRRLLSDNLLNRPHLLKRMARKEGVKNEKNGNFLDDIIYGQPLVALLYRLFLE